MSFLPKDSRATRIRAAVPTTIGKLCSLRHGAIPAPPSPIAPTTGKPGRDGPPGRPAHAPRKKSAKLSTLSPDMLCLTE
ncbi:MAG: hypothetical protein EOP85_14630 [Verrucomicrobiaceae bacterium]|nr:MAG: hypothetical protein EOP85_14630 [Verrucomicrobiaceae bacterium]